jgi:preprotein translocase subunit SecG
VVGEPQRAGAARARTSAAGAAGAAGARSAAGSPPVRRYRVERSSPARATLLIVGGLVVAIAIVVVVIVSLGGGSKGSGASTHTGSQASTTKTSSTDHRAKSSTSHTSVGGTALSANAANTEVAVLNGTSTTGLAHRISAELRTQGFTKATPLGGTPPGANETTVVEYASGHSAEAQSVAHALGVSQAQPIEGTVASMANSAPVVVIVGLDKASTSP